MTEAAELVAVLEARRDGLLSPQEASDRLAYIVAISNLRHRLAEIARTIRRPRLRILQTV